MKGYEYDESDGSWVWMKPRSRKDPDAPRTVLGRFKIKDNRLIAETNSRERTARLRSELKDHLGGLTPIQAAKTENGRAKLKALLDDIERMEEAAASTRPKVDVDRLRRMLGLPPKAN